MYFFVSWHTLTRKHNKYNVGDEVEPLEVPGDDDEYFGSLSLSTQSLGSSREKLIEKVSSFTFDQKRAQLISHAIPR